MSKRKTNGSSGKRNPNGAGTLIKRGNTYLARWAVGKKKITHPDGTVEYKYQYKAESTHTGDIEAARAFLADKTREYNLDREDKTVEKLLDLKSVLSVKREKLTREREAEERAKPALRIISAFTAYKNSSARPDSGERTLSDYEGKFGVFTEWIKTAYPEITELRQVTETIADGFMETIRDKYSAGTYNKYAVFFKCMWGVLFERARLTVNPWTHIKHRQVIPHTRRELTVEELSKVCAYVTGEMRTLFALGIYTGLRLGDCALLEWGAVDILRGIITLIPRKTKRYSDGKPTVIPIHAALVNILSETEPKNRHGYVMPDIAAQYQNNDALLSRYIMRVFTKCGIETSKATAEGERAKVDVGFHSLRHTFVSLSANAGAPLAVVQAIVGHSNPAMTRHYYHECVTALQSAVATLPNLTGGEPTAEIVSPQLAAFMAAYDKLTADEKKAAAKYISKKG